MTVALESVKENRVPLKTEKTGKLHPTLFLLLYKTQIFLSPLLLVYQLYWSEYKQQAGIGIVSLIAGLVSLWAQSVLSGPDDPDFCCYSENSIKGEGGLCSDPRSDINVKALIVSQGGERQSCSSFSFTSIAFLSFGLLFIAVFIINTSFSLARHKVDPSFQWMFDPIVFTLHLAAFNSSFFHGIIGVLFSLVTWAILIAALINWQIRATYDFCLSPSLPIEQVDHSACEGKTAGPFDFIRQVETSIPIFFAAGITAAISFLIHIISICKLGFKTHFIHHKLCNK